jgi:hypothetical protein
MIITNFFGVKDGDPKQLSLDYVPRVNDTIALDNENLYRVKEVIWQLTSTGLREVGMELEYVRSCKSATSG